LIFIVQCGVPFNQFYAAAECWWICSWTGLLTSWQ